MGWTLGRPSSCSYPGTSTPTTSWLGSAGSCGELRDYVSYPTTTAGLVLRHWCHQSHGIRHWYSLFLLPPTAHPHSSIVVGNGNLLPVTATGTTHLPPNFNLTNVLVSPDLIKNLVSVRRFTTDNNCSVEFDPFGCSVKDLPTRREIV